MFVKILEVYLFSICNVIVKLWNTLNLPKSSTAPFKVKYSSYSASVLQLPAYVNSDNIFLIYSSSVLMMPEFLAYSYFPFFGGATGFNSISICMFS